jgi:hypothetical protein
VVALAGRHEGTFGPAYRAVRAGRGDGQNRSWLRGQKSGPHSRDTTNDNILVWPHSFTNATSLDETLRKELLRPGETYPYLERNLLETTELNALTKSRGEHGLTPLRAYRQQVESKSNTTARTCETSETGPIGLHGPGLRKAVESVAPPAGGVSLGPSGVADHVGGAIESSGLIV